MIDIGAHGVFIDPHIVNNLGFRRFKLSKPCRINLALQNGQHSVVSLDEYVKIKPYTTNSAWSSVTLKAIIAPGLCVPLLLGVPFLESNHIVIDCNSRTVIDKR